MSDEQVPLDLRTLADVDSPEVVRAALRTFRRRIVTRYVWLGVGALVLVAAVMWGRTPSTLQQRIDGANAAVVPEAVWHVPGGTVALDRVVDLGDTVGLHLIVLPDGRSQPRPHVSVTGEVSSMWYGSWDEYLEIAPSRGGIPVLTVKVQGHVERIPLDQDAGIPTQIWR